MNLVVIYGSLHPKEAEYIRFSSALQTFSRIDHMLGHKTSFNKFKKIETISIIFCEHNGMRIEINYKKKLAKPTNMEAKQYATKTPVGH